MKITSYVSGQVIKMRHSKMIKVFGLTSISTFVRIITSFISVKVIAVIIGPAGVAMLGQLNNFTSMIMTASTAGIGNGVIKYVAELQTKQSQLRIYLSTAFSITLLASGACGISLLLFAPYLSKIILFDPKYSLIFRIFGLTIILFALNSFLINILNGFKEFRKYVIVNIVTSIVGLLFSVILVWLYNIKGALISSVTFQSVVLVITILFAYKSDWFNKRYFFFRINWVVSKKLLAYSMMALTTAATSPVAQLLIRGKIIRQISSLQAGWWEAMNRLSGISLLIITSSLGIYYLPRLSELKEKNEIKSEILKAYKLVIPTIIVIFTVVIIMKNIIITTVFTSEFIPMRDLFIWQVFGDFFKICSWVLSFLMVAKAKTNIFIFSEIFFTLCYIALSFILININGVVGVTQAYFFNYILYFIFMIVWVRKAILK